MAAKRGHPRQHGNKVRVTISLDPDLYDWLRKMVESKDFGSVTHGVEKAVDEYRKKLGR
jgi:Arc/MetJ-type ribon-helix-helix transcriptional regulator